MWAMQCTSHIVWIASFVSSTPAVGHETGVRDEQIDRPVGVERRLDHRLDRRLVAHVDRHRRATDVGGDPLGLGRRSGRPRPRGEHPAAWAARAMASPIPDPAPVTTTTRSSQFHAPNRRRPARSGGKAVQRVAGVDHRRCRRRRHSTVSFPARRRRRRRPRCRRLDAPCTATWRRGTGERHPVVAAVVDDERTDRAAEPSSPDVSERRGRAGTTPRRGTSPRTDRSAARTPRRVDRSAASARPTSRPPGRRVPRPPRDRG